jgi:radical SAM superfamily enzyme YgiQ (UPF0313 family)
MSRIFFTSLNTCSHPCQVYPLGVAVIADTCRRFGHDVQVYDYLAAGKNQSDLIAEATKYQPDYIGVSLRNLDDNVGSSYEIDNTKKLEWISNLVQQIKTATSAPIILGGSAFSLMPQTILDLTGADYGIVGEGEKAFTKLLDDLEKNNKSDRIIYGSHFSIDGAEIKGALYDRSLVEYYYDQSDFINVQTKRGCPFQCLYCTYPTLEGNSFRYRNNDEIVDEIARLKKDYNCNNFFFTDSIFNDPVGHYRQLLEVIIANDLNIKWTAYFTPYRLTKSDIDLCKKAGLFAVELGTDASSSTTLAGLNKMFDWNDVVKANNIVTQADIACAHSVIFGGPDETYQTLEEGIKNCRKLENCVVFGFGGVRIYPDSPLLKRALAEDVIKENTSLLEPFYYFSPEIEEDKMTDMICRGWSNDRRLLFPPAKAEMMSKAIKKMFNIKGLLWDKINLLK